MTARLAKRVLAAFALLPAVYAAAFVLALWFYGASLSFGEAWSWPTVFVIAGWITVAAGAITGASLAAFWGWLRLTDVDR